MSHIRRIQTISSQIGSDAAVVYDVCVVGGGINGTSIAYQLSKAGMKVLLLEQYAVGHDNGSSHGDGRIIRLAYVEDIYVELAKLAYPLWNEIENESGEKVLHKTGGVDFGGPTEKALTELISTYKRQNTPYEILEPQAANERFPQFSFKEGDLIVYQKDAGVVYAGKAVRTIWGLCKRHGCTVLDNKKVDRVKIESPELATILTYDQCVYKAKKVVMAAGGWTNELLLRSQLNLQIPLEITQEKVFYWEKKASAPKDVDYSQYSCPISIYYGADGNCFYMLPQIEVPGMKIGLHYSGTPMNNMIEKGKKYYKAENLKTIQTFLGTYFPSLDNEKESSSLTCVYSNTPDQHFLIDKHPRHSNLIIASVCSGHGFKFGPATGRIVTELVKNGKITSLTNPSEFSLDRFKKEISKRYSA